MISELGINIATSFFGWALNALWKRALYLSELTMRHAFIQFDDNRQSISRDHFGTLKPTDGHLLRGRAKCMLSSLMQIALD